jgi:hypothetical protein
MWSKPTSTGSYSDAILRAGKAQARQVDGPPRTEQVQDPSAAELEAWNDPTDWVDQEGRRVFCYGLDKLSQAP